MQPLPLSLQFSCILIQVKLEDEDSDQFRLPLSLPVHLQCPGQVVQRDQNVSESLLLSLSPSPVPLPPDLSPSESRKVSVRYEEEVLARKSSVMCRIKGFRDRPSCFVKKVQTVERPELRNVTRVTAKCCEGYAISGSGGCSPVCASSPCESGLCVAPNACQEVPATAPATADKAAVDYYDEGATETSTPVAEQESSREGHADPSGEVPLAEVTEADPFADYDSMLTTEGEGELEGAEEQNEWLSLVIWVSVFVSVLFTSILVYLVYLKISRKRCDISVVEFKR